MSSLVNVRELPMHTKMEVAVGHAFDVLNGKVNSVMFDSDAQVLDEAERSFYLISPDTMIVVEGAEEIRNIIEEDFKFIQGRDVKMLINRLSENVVGIAVCHFDKEESVSSYKSGDDEEFYDPLPNPFYE